MRTPIRLVAAVAAVLAGLAGLSLHPDLARAAAVPSTDAALVAHVGRLVSGLSTSAARQALSDSTAAVSTPSAAARSTSAAPTAAQTSAQSAQRAVTQQIRASVRTPSTARQKALPVPVSVALPPVGDPGTPTTDPTTPAAGDTLPRGDVTSNGRTWTQSYAEDFSRDAPLGRVSSVYPGIDTYDGFSDTSGQGLYAPDRVLSVANGTLDFWLHSENGRPLVAAIMPDGYAPHTTGRVSIRYRSDTTAGYKFVGMFWPVSDDWNEGEIDWPEADLGRTPRPASAVPGSFRNGGMTFRPATEAFAPTDSTGYHVATTEWDTHAIRYYWDGVLVSTVTDAVPTTPMRVTLQAETFLGQGAVPKTSSGHLDIDWISIWD
ncbi:Beta-glucanase [Frondihabitans sp. 762G35]|uniref:glycoside hydrolase family 16 protein n=1 Tax=Frondihabitans sp. 762G35 TaxID=1446794 RepID=UPI000D20F981|nr:glycoside hydrolase family 16 protein [Frondihabitans sp. 762G35]ARC57221.1 Beta-glucanase [Frondihabitans sp. 762G35]